MNKNRYKLKKSLLSSAILCAIGSAQSAIIQVDDDCSLIEAMETANSDFPVGTCIVGNGADTIQVVTENDNIVINTIFEPSANGPGAVGLPIVTSNMTIEGNGITIRADNSTDDFRLFEVGLGGDLTLRDSTVTGANDGVGFGSGLLAYGGRVSIENSTFALNNGAVLIANGFGNEINNSVIRHNLNDSSYAAGLQVFFAEVNITQTSVVDNEHAYNDFVRGGVGGTFAGGVGLLQSNVTITESTLSGNKSIYGGGLFIIDDAPLPLPSKLNRFADSSLRGVISSEIQITNSTITNNLAYIGAGILDLGNDSELTLQGSIVAGNKGFSNSFGLNIYSIGNSTFNLDGNNIIGDNGSTGTVNITLGASDSSFSDYAQDNLYPLSLSQGQLVHPLKMGSIAIDGNDLTCYGSINDQEGKGRGIDGDDDGSFICDIGAFEHSLAIIADGAPCIMVNALVSANTDASVGGCQPGNGHDIVVLPENSTQTFASIVDFLADSSFPIGIASIDTAVTLEANGSLIERDTNSLEAFDLFGVEAGAQLNLIDAVVTGANGNLGAVSSYNGNLNVLNSDISNNQSAGVFDFFSINSSVVNSTVSQNTILYAAGTGYSFSPLTTFQSTGFELSNSTISGNVGGLGGGVDFRGVTLATMENSTVSGNSAVSVGGLLVTAGYYSQFMPIAKIRNSTITANSGSYTGGIYAGANSPNSLSMSDSIVSGNQYVVAPPRVITNNNTLGQGLNLIRGPGAVPSEIYSSPYFSLDANNIIGQNGDSGTVGALLGGSDTVPAGATSTVIESLADNGGGTLTHLPVLGGLAVDGGDQSCRLNEDQTGRIRPWDGDGDGNENCDIGSVELGSIYASDIIFKDGFDPTIIVRRSLLGD